MTALTTLEPRCSAVSAVDRTTALPRFYEAQRGSVWLVGAVRSEKDIQRGAEGDR